MGHRVGPAVPPGVDPGLLSLRLSQAHDAFVSDGHLDPVLRPVVADSWRRSLRTGLDPESSIAGIALDETRLAEIRAVHPLAVAMPLIRRLLVDDAADAGLLVAVSDAAGRLLWVEGCPRLRSRAEAMHFLPGADWSEASAGPNAPGTALTLGTPVQFLGPEHLVRQVTPWSCSAAPIREPDTGALLGVLDITGGPEVASRQTLTLVRATVAAVEAELRWERVQPPEAPTGLSGGDRSARLAFLGRRTAGLRYGSTTTTLSLRHSEIVLLLTDQPEGLTANELAVSLSDIDQARVTVRAEMSRLRAALGPVQLTSRPYRLRSEVRTDLAELRDHLRTGALRRAVAGYRGPLLPTSTAPAVERLRADLHAQIRSRVLASRDPDVLLAFADTAYARDDFDVWRAVERSLPPGSPRAAEVGARLDALHRALA